MTSILNANTFFCVFLTLTAFAAGRALQKKWNTPLLNPILVSFVIISIVITAAGISVDDYQENCAPLRFLLTPATICFSVSLYEQVGALRKHLAAILAGVAAGTLASVLGIRLMALLFRLDHALTVSLLPKSVTTAIGMALSEEAGGIAALTTAVIIITGVLGNMFGSPLIKLFRLKHPISQGVALGTSAHAIGTTKANELSALAGAVSSMSLTLAGLITVVLFSFVAG